MSLLEIKQIDSLDDNFARTIHELEKVVFDDPMSPEALREEFAAHAGWIALVAYAGGKPCGYKIGYAQSAKRFYSWIGGVHPDFRGRGLAKELMRTQHEAAKAKGYKYVVTHTHNKYLPMLILNLKSGFQITGTKLNAGSDSLTIIMEKEIRGA